LEATVCRIAAPYMETRGAKLHPTGPSAMYMFMFLVQAWLRLLLAPDGSETLLFAGDFD